MDPLCCLISVIGIVFLLAKAWPSGGHEREPAAPAPAPARYGNPPVQPGLPRWPVSDAVYRTAAAVNHLQEVAAAVWMPPLGVDELIAEGRYVTGETVQMILSTAYASGPDLRNVPPAARDHFDTECTQLNGLSHELSRLAAEIGSAPIPGHAERVRELRWRVAALTDALRDFPHS